MVFKIIGPLRTDKNGKGWIRMERSQDEREEDEEGEGKTLFFNQSKLSENQEKKLRAYQVRIREVVGRNGAKEPET